MVFYGLALPSSAAEFCLIVCIVILTMPLWFNMILVGFSFLGAKIKPKHFMSYKEFGKSILNKMND